MDSEGKCLKRLLFVDDDIHVGRSFARMMRRYDIAVDVVDSGSLALEMVKQHYYSVVVTDLHMPGMDGLTLIKTIQADHPTLTYVVVTGLPDLDLQSDRSYDHSIVSIVPKPWNEAELVAILRRACKMQEARQAAATRAPPRIASVLLVEDDEVDRIAVARYLKSDRSRQYDLVSAERLDEALEKLVQRHFDIVLADLSLPDARGLDTVDRIHSVAPESAIIVLTGFDDETIAVQAMQLGAQDFLPKAKVQVDILSRAMRYAQERKQAERRLEQLARQDQLTGLANRSTFHERLTRALQRAKRSGRSFAVMYLDLDRFKSINDGYGHNVGDALLQHVAFRLTETLREVDTIARLGGDEFAVLLEDADRENSAFAAQRICDAFSEPVALGDYRIEITSSIGIALFPNDATKEDELLRKADMAMYSCKASGRNQFVFFDGKASQTAIRQETLYEAVARNEFILFYQPQVNLKTGEVCAQEALLRWQAGKTIIPPDRFIPELERTNLILEVGEWVLHESIQQLKTWRRHGQHQLRMAVNVSARQFERPGLPEVIETMLQRESLPPNAIELEITESVLMADTRQTNATLHALKELGVRIVIDDFGTGYSSLAYLHRFHVDGLKIDRSFIPGVPDNQKSKSIAASIISLGRQLELDVVAEGVENRRHLAFLQSQGCGRAQGFLLGEPSPTGSFDPIGFRARHSLP
jgi:diguanylate cyclase (GGDEF)-like protein